MQRFVFMALALTGMGLANHMLTHVHKRKTAIWTQKNIIFSIFSAKKLNQGAKIGVETHFKRFLRNFEIFHIFSHR